MQRDQPSPDPGDLGRSRGTAGEGRAASDSRRGLQASGMGFARLREFRGSCVLGEDAQVLRFGTTLEVRQAIRAVRTEGQTNRSKKRRKKTGVRKPGRGLSRIYTEHLIERSV